MTKTFLLSMSAIVFAGPVVAQDTTRVDQGVRIGVDYTPGTRPGLVVVPGAGLDSVRAIVRRDLDYTDRFEMVTVADLPSGSSTSPGAADPPNGVNYALYKSLGAQYAVELNESPGGVTARLHDLNEGRMQSQKTVPLPSPSAPDYRLEVHRLADEVARWASGQPGPAASRLLFVSGGRVYRVDSDGADIAPITPAGQTALSPAWSPDGQRMAFTLLGEGRGGIVVQNVSGGNSFLVPG